MRELIIGKNDAGQRLDKFITKTLDFPFYGVYSGRVGRPVDPETIYYLTNENLENVKAIDYENGGIFML